MVLGRLPGVQPMSAMLIAVRELLAHCYRMLGSVDEAEDLVQETYLRAWRSYDTFEGRASPRTWLHRIATNACLSALEQRTRRALPSGLGGPAEDPDGMPAPAEPEVHGWRLADDPHRRQRPARAADRTANDRAGRLRGRRQETSVRGGLPGPS